jgi:hypothetical protein
MTHSGFYVALIMYHCLPPDFTPENFQVISYDEVETINNLLRRPDYVVIFTDLNETIGSSQINLDQPEARVLLLTTWGDKILTAVQNHISAYKIYRLSKESLQQSLQEKIRSLPEELQARVSRTSYRPESEKTQWNRISVLLSESHSRLIYQHTDEAKWARGDTRLVNFLSLVAAPQVKKLNSAFRSQKVEQSLLDQLTQRFNSDPNSYAPKLQIFKNNVLAQESGKHLVIGSHLSLLKVLVSLLFEKSDMPLYLPQKRCNDPQVAAFNSASRGLCLLTDIPYDLNTGVQQIHVLEGFPFDLTRRLANHTLPDSVNLYVALYAPGLQQFGLQSPDSQLFQLFVQRSRVADEAVERLVRVAQEIDL